MKCKADLANTFLFSMMCFQYKTEKIIELAQLIINIYIIIKAITLSLFIDTYPFYHLCNF